MEKKMKNSEAKPKKRGKGMSFVEAAEKVLTEEKKPLAYKEITSLAITKGYLITDSKSPEISMHVSLSTEIKRRKDRNEPQRFESLGQGYFRVIEQSEETKTALQTVKDSRNEVIEKMFERLTSTDHGTDFEAMVGGLLNSLGYEEVEIIGGKDDQGVDLTCEKRDGITKIKFAIQCKCLNEKRKVGPKDISTLRDNLSTYQCQRGILITTSSLNDKAKTKAKESGKEPIHYIEKDEILELFLQNSIGVRSETIRYFQIDNTTYEFLG